MTEIYFGNKIHGDDTASILDSVSTHLSVIDFSRWSDLHWKELTKEITDDEREELETESNRILGEIKVVMNAMKNDVNFTDALKRVRESDISKRIEKSYKK